MSSPSNTSSRLLRRDLMTPKSSAETIVSSQRDSGDYRVSVFFPSAPTLQKVEMLRVQMVPLQPSASGLTRKKTEVIPLRLHVPGALVTPAEQGIEAMPQGTAEVIFYVTPFAKGTLPAAHLEVLYPGRTETTALPLKVRAPRSWLSALALVIVPLLLWLPTCWPELAGGQVEQRLLDWLPHAGFAGPIAHLLQNGYSYLAKPHFPLSFWSLLLIAACWCIWTLSQRARIIALHGDVYRFQAAAKTTTPPPFLTPLTEHEIAEIQQHK